MEEKPRALHEMAPAVTVMSPRLGLLPLCLLCPVLAASVEAPGASTASTSPDSAPDAPSIRFAAARNGAEVLLTWEITVPDVRQVELMRHTRRDQRGRGRVATVRARPGTYTDQVPDPSATYWYWLKVTLASGQVIGSNAVKTPPAEVWQPTQ